MAAYHTVEQGEHLPLIAHKYAFASYLTIWDHPNNADLKEKRRNPNVLFPGDQVFIPDKETKQVEVKAGQFSRFRVKQDKLLLRLVLDQLFGEPLKNAECEVRIDARVKNVVGGDDGTIEIEVPASAGGGELIIKGNEQRPEGIVIPFKIGHLDPVEEIPGQVARLNNLGYFAGSTDNIDESLLASAVEEFQCDHGLKVDGVCEKATQTKLREVHGS
jgi:hypothetical protein